MEVSTDTPFSTALALDPVADVEASRGWSGRGPCPAARRRAWPRTGTRCRGSRSGAPGTSRTTRRAARRGTPSRHGLVPGRVHDGAVGHAGQHLPGRLDAHDVGRVVQRREVGELAEGREGVVVDDAPTSRTGRPRGPRGGPTALISRQVVDGAVDLGLQQGLHDELDGDLVVGAVVLDASCLPRSACCSGLCTSRRRSTRSTMPRARTSVLVPPVELVLQRGAAAVERQDVHGDLLL